MGCFNSYGYLSNLPIVEGDDIFVFICAKRKESNYLIPIFFPIFGKYNDYGGLYSIEEDNSTKWLIENININLDTVIKLLTKNHLEEQDKEVYEQIKKGLLGKNPFDLQYDLCITIDHRKVFDIISDLCISDATESYKIAVDNENILTKFYQYKRNFTSIRFKYAKDSEDKYVGLFDRFWETNKLCINQI